MDKIGKVLPIIRLLNAADGSQARLRRVTGLSGAHRNVPQALSCPTRLQDLERSCITAVCAVGRRSRRRPRAALGAVMPRAALLCEKSAATEKSGPSAECRGAGPGRRDTGCAGPGLAAENPRNRLWQWRPADRLHGAARVGAAAQEPPLDDNAGMLPLRQYLQTLPAVQFLANAFLRPCRALWSRITSKD